jgi:hypothetical protein
LHPNKEQQGYFQNYQIFLKPPTKRSKGLQSYRKKELPFSTTLKNQMDKVGQSSKTKFGFLKNKRTALTSCVKIKSTFWLLPFFCVILGCNLGLALV